MPAKIFLSLILFPLLCFTTNHNNLSQTEHLIYQNDSTSFPLYEEFDAEGNTLWYRADIETEVCRARVCEIAHITFYWDEIGDFLKYTLPNGKDLTKYDHKPFNADDYKTLTRILSDPNSLLKKLSFDDINDIIEKAQKEVDAITGATPGELANAVVRDAAFSTYTFWHMVYGAARDSIKNQLESKSNLNYVLQKLGSEKANVKIWAIKKAKEKFNATKVIDDKIIKLISDKNIDVASEAFRFFSNSELESQGIQQAVISQFQNFEAITKFDVLYRFKRLEKIYPETFTYLLKQFIENKVGVSAYTHIMQIGKLVGEPSVEALAIIEGLLNHENFYVSRKAYEYLKGYPMSSRQMERELKKYEKKYADRLN